MKRTYGLLSLILLFISTSKLINSRLPPPWRPPAEPSGIGFPKDRWIPIDMSETWKSIPDIYGNYISWIERDEPRSSILNPYWNVFLYDLETNSKKQINVTANCGSINPKIYGTKVAWAKSCFGNSEIFIYDIATEELTSRSFSGSIGTSIGFFEDLIVFSWDEVYGSFPDIFLYNISTETITNLTNTPKEECASASRTNWCGYESAPDLIRISDTTFKIIWVEVILTQNSLVAWDGYSAAIVYDDLPVSILDPGNVAPQYLTPQIAPSRVNDRDNVVRCPVIGMRDGQSRVVYERKVDYDFQLFYTDLNDLQETPIPSEEIGYFCSGPDISGNLIVWEDNRYGVGGDIFLFDDTPEESYEYDGRTFRLTDYPGNAHPAVDGDNIVFPHWDDEGYGERNEIYLIDLTQPPTVELSVWSFIEANSDWLGTLGLVLVVVVAVIPTVVVIDARRLCEKYPELCSGPPSRVPSRRHFWMTGIGSALMLITSIGIYISRWESPSFLVFGGIVFGAGMATAYLQSSRLIPVIFGYRALKRRS